MGENLNIEDNIKELVLKSISKSKTLAEASRRLRISDKSLKRYRHKFGIVEQDHRLAVTKKVAYN